MIVEPSGVVWALFALWFTQVITLVYILIFFMILWVVFGLIGIFYNVIFKFLSFSYHD